MDTNANTASNEPKYYLAKAIERSPEQGKTAKEVTFVVVGPDYKSAWQTARKLTARGHAHFAGEAFTDQTRGTPMEMVPGEFTVKSVESLQQRSKKVDPVTIDQLMAELQKQGKTLPKGVAEIVESLRAKGPLTEPTAGEADSGAGGEGGDGDRQVA